MKDLGKSGPVRFLLITGVGLGALLSAVAGIGSTVILTNYERYADDFVPPEQLRVDQHLVGAQILDRYGQPLHQYLGDQGVRRPIRLEDVSPALLAATIATEDATFFSNAGINVRGIARAASENLNLFGEDDLLSGSGGSSITQQLVKNLYIPQDYRTERSLDRKLREVVYALELTRLYSKGQILEWYLNRISYGGMYAGVEAASQAYFGKSASQLTLAEAALLAGIPQAPAKYDPVSSPEAAQARRDQVLDLMKLQSPIQIGPDTYFTLDDAELAAARETPVEVLSASYPVRAPHFIFSYIGPQLEALVGKDAIGYGGLIVTTTLDLEVQSQAEASVEHWVSQFEEISNTRNGAAMVVDARTGEILAMVGSRDYFRDDIDGYVNNLFAPNSPGSSFKPFVYLAAFELLGWKDSTIIQDTPVTYKEPDGRTFSPTNPSRGYHGSITLRNALGNSLNVPAFKAAQQLGVHRIVDFARSVGFTSLDGSYGPAIAIGGVDLKAFDLTYGYATLANNGVMTGQDTFAPVDGAERAIEPIGILRIEDSAGNVLFDVDQHRVERRVIRPEHAAMMADILSDPNAQCITFGCGGLQIPGHRAGIKTGTSEPFDPEGPNKGKIGETWAFGFTQDYAVGVWAGNSDNAPIVNIYSTSISYRAMRDILLAAYARPAALAGGE